MAWEITAYAVAAVCVTIVVAVIVAAAAVRRLILGWKAEWERLSREAEATLQQWRRLGQEASETAEVCRSNLEGFETFAQGGRALGEAAQTAAKAAADTVVRWTERVQDRIADMEERQTRRLGNALDWMDIGINLWHSWSQRNASAPDEADRQPGDGASADEHR